MNDKVLVIDDDPGVCSLVEALLSKVGYQVYKAFSGEEGISMANAMVPGAIILDIVLPGMSGLETCRYLKTLTRLRNTPVIIVTESLDRRNVTMMTGVK